MITEGAMIAAIARLITREAAFLTARFGVKPVAIGIELGFDENFVDGDAEFIGEKKGFIPGGALHFEAFDVGGKSRVMK